MTFLAVAAFIEKFGPTAIQALPVLQNVYESIKAGKGQTEVTTEDVAQLVALGKKSSADYLREAGGAPMP